MRKTPFRVTAGWSALAVIVAMAYAAVLHFLTDAWTPWLASIILTFSVLGQFLLVGRHIENWYAWLLVDSIAVPLYAMRELYLTSGLYFFFLCNVCYGLMIWRRELTLALSIT